MCVPSGNEKFDTHLWSSSSLEHLGQIQEIRHISGQVQRPQVWVFGQGICTVKPVVGVPRAKKISHHCFHLSSPVRMGCRSAELFFQLSPSKSPLGILLVTTHSWKCHDSYQQSEVRMMTESTLHLHKDCFRSLQCKPITAESTHSTGTEADYHPPKCYMKWCQVFLSLMYTKRTQGLERYITKLGQKTIMTSKFCLFFFFLQQLALYTVNSLTKKHCDNTWSLHFRSYIKAKNSVTFIHLNCKLNVRVLNHLGEGRDDI